MNKNEMRTKQRNMKAMDKQQNEMKKKQKDNIGEKCLKEYFHK